MVETITGKDYKITWYGHDLLDDIARGLNDAVFESGEVIINAATSKAPVKEGVLRKTGYVSTRTKSSYQKRKGHRNEVHPRDDGMAVAAFSAPHAHLVEFGTVNMGPQPFFRPALDEVQGGLSVTIANSLKRRMVR